ncbi:MAG: c-type cytochrome [Candidatus Binatia bacterium]
MKKMVFVLLLIAAAVAAAAWMLRKGVSARDEPSALEAFVAGRLRRLAIPVGARDTKNPIPAAPEVVAEGREHFASHCSVCHANDGSGETDIGRGLYPKPPDMRKERTQSLSDGELFYIIRNGVRFTGMPGWGGEDADEDKESWELVQFIRHLPELAPEELHEMKRLNPQSPKEVEEEIEEREFLSGHEGEHPRPHQHGSDAHLAP